MPAMAPADKPFPPPLTTAKKNIQIRSWGNSQITYVICKFHLFSNDCCKFKKVSISRPTIAKRARSCWNLPERIRWSPEF